MSSRLNPIKKNQCRSTMEQQRFELAFERVPLVEQELPTKSGAPELTPGFLWGRVTRSLVLYVCFVNRCLSVCTFSFSHCDVCSSSIYGF